MPARRIIAFIVLILNAYFVLNVAPGLGMFGPVAQLIGILVGVGALASLIFNISLSKKHHAVRNNTVAAKSRIRLSAAGLAGFLLFVAAPLFIAARGVYSGVLPSFLRPHHSDISFTQEPGLFVLNLLAYAGLGCTFLLLLLRGRRTRKDTQAGTK